MGAVSIRQRIWNGLERLARPLSDRMYLAIIFRRRFGRWPALLKPGSFNERILAYKLSSRRDARMPLMSDKIAVKPFVASRVGEAHVIPLIWQGRALPPRSQRLWPKPYVVKAAHGWNSHVFVRGDPDEDWDRIEALCERWVSTVHGSRRLEWHYARIPPRIMVEPYIGSGDQVPPDYKFFVFHGRVGLIWKDEGRYGEHRRYTFDRDWRPLAFDFYHRRGPVDPARPETLEQMIDVAERLAAGFEFVSIDLYDVDGQVLFGEMTFFPAGGHGRFYPADGDWEAGKLWADAAAAARPRNRLGGG